MTNCTLILIKLSFLSRTYYWSYTEFTPTKFASYLSRTFRYWSIISGSYQILSSFSCSYSSSFKWICFMPCVCSNRIGWDLFLKGYISEQWIQLYSCIRSDPMDTPQPLVWIEFLRHGELNLLKDIWDERNAKIHGQSMKESQCKVREP